MGLKGFDETDNVLVVGFVGFGEFFVELDLSAKAVDEFFGFVEGGFLDDLECVVLFGVVELLVDFVASSKTALD